MKQTFKFVLLVVLATLLLPASIRANGIELDQDWGVASDWTEHKLISESNLIVSSNVTLSLSRIFYNYSDHYSFTFFTTEPDYVSEPEDFVLRVFSLGRELKNSIDFQDAKAGKRGWGWAEHNITIFQNNSIREWSDYTISIEYKLKDFVKRKGETHYFELNKFCNSWGTKQVGEQCPSGNGVRTHIILNNPKLKLISYPEYANKTVPNGIDSLAIYGASDYYEIQFLDVNESEFWSPLKWMLVGIVITAFFGLVFKAVYPYVLPFDKLKFKKELDAAGRKHFSRLWTDVLSSILSELKQMREQHLWQPREMYDKEFFTSKYKYIKNATDITYEHCFKNHTEFECIYRDWLELIELHLPNLREMLLTAVRMLDNEIAAEGFKIFSSTEFQNNLEENKAQKNNAINQSVIFSVLEAYFNRNQSYSDAHKISTGANEFWVGSNLWATVSDESKYHALAKILLDTENLKRFDEIKNKSTKYWDKKVVPLVSSNIKRLEVLQHKLLVPITKDCVL